MKNIVFAGVLVFLWTCAACATERPNLLWITSEDNSPYLGCYGDAQALTPRLDALAAEGVRYTNAFANAPVCSAARTTLILGMYPPSVGLQHHRSRYAIPDEFPRYPELLREAGYYCTNNVKTDYNLARPVGPEWDACSATAHYKNRAEGQPFFAIFNLTTTHESQPRVAPDMRASGRLPAQPRLSHEEIVIPPYHPRVPDVVDEWVNYYDQITLLDSQVGRMLDDLDAAGLADDTIVFYYSDHGGALPRGKRNLHDSGTRVPLIVRFPEKWKHLAPTAPGGTSDRPVSFVDFAPTLLSLAGVAIPETMEGRAFLGGQAVEGEPYVFLFRGRMDERHDFARAVRDTRYRYIRNFSPHLPYGQHYSYPFEVLKSMRAWHAAYLDGECDAVQSAYWQPKSSEELYDTWNDPHEIKNLAGDPAHATRLAEMREALFSKMISIRDTGLIPESMFSDLAGDRTLHDYARSEAYPIERLLAVADAATSRDPRMLPALVEAMRDPHPVARYWGAMGCVVLEQAAAPARTAVGKLVEDSVPAVRIAAAHALGRIGDRETALGVLGGELASDDDYVVLEALGALDTLRPLEPTMRPLFEDVSRRRLSNSQRISNYFLEELKAER